MKIPAVSTTLNQRCRLRNWTLQAALLALMLLTGMMRAQVTNVLYQDNFARVGPLDGSAPDTVNAPGARWLACNSAPENAVLMTDGTRVCLTNSPTPTNGLYLNAFLPFTPEVGHIYTLSCKMSTASGAAQFLMLGFTTSARTNSSFNEYRLGAGWVEERGDGAQFKGTRGPGSLNQGALNTAFGSTTNLYTVVLDTTTGNAHYGWTFRFYTNGVTSVGPSAYPYGNLPIKYVALGSDGATGYFHEFTLTDALIRQGAPSISEQPPSRTAPVGQTATFWVGVTNDYPSAAYQWMVNSPGGPTNAIAGATNAVYTTPALDMSYNGLNYSVVITNALGATNSEPATLTVVPEPPTIYSVTKTPSPTSLVVAFSKPVDPVTGLNAANYSLDLNSAPSGIAILSASFGAVPNSVILTTSTLDTNAGYYLRVQNVQDLYGNALASTTVPVLPANMVLFLRADSGVVLDQSGSLVVRWLDQTTNGNHAAQYFGVPTYGLAAASARPTLGSLNGHVALSFANTIPACGNFLVAPSSASLESMISNTTMYALAQFSSFSPANELMSKTWGNLPAPFDWTQGGGISVQYGNGGNNAPASGIGASIGLNTPYVMTAMLTMPTAAGGTTNFNMYLNGSPNGNGAIRSVVQGISDGGQPLWIGGRNDLKTANMKGQIAELMLFNTALSDADRAIVDNYLGRKYFQFAITTDLPASTTSSNGFAVTYRFAASAGSAHGFSYQWQRNGTNIPGATASTYTTPILAPGDDGSTFVVQVTMPDGSHVYSTQNTLTVLNMPPYVTCAGIPIWNANQLMVIFNQAAVDPATAANVSNYSLDNGASVISAALGDQPNKVVLTTSPLPFNADPGHYTLSVSNVRDLYGNTMVAAALPVGMYPPAAVWIRSDTGVTTDAGTNTVTQWNDLSGNNNHFFVGSGTPVQPWLVTNAWGDPVVRFNPTDTVTNYMIASHSASLSILGDMSIVAVVNPRALGGSRGLIVSKTGAGTGTKDIPAPYEFYFGPQAGLFRGNGNGTAGGINYGSFGATTGLAAGYPCVVGVSETGEMVSHYLNGQGVGTGLLANGNYLTANNWDQGQPVYIGARSSFLNRLTGDLAELLLSPVPLSSGDMAALSSYLSTRHHFAPFNPNPTNLVVSFLNNQLTFSWPADHTGWQLQSNSVGLQATEAWFTVSGSTATNQLTITPDPSQTNVFYRMFFQQP